jgi:hypothetical protein
MDAILYLHHLPLTEAVTKKHCVLLKALNRDAEVIPLKFENCNESSEWQWENGDILVYEWFLRENPKHERFFIIEFDTFCSQSLKDFYGDSYNKKVVGSMIIRPWSDNIAPLDKTGFEQRERDWDWFGRNRSPLLYPFLRGIVPMSGVMLSHEALFNMVQLWKTVPDFKQLQNECRIGTLAAMAGYEPEQIRTDCWKYIHAANVEIDHGPGVYHAVKV